MMAEHTPTPWEYRKAEEGWTAHIDGADGQAVVWPSKLAIEPDNGIIHDADAAFIVKAVNLHDELVAALRSMAAAYVAEPEDPAQRVLAWMNATAALTKAEA